MNALMTIAVIGASAIGQWTEAASRGVPLFREQYARILHHGKDATFAARVDGTGPARSTGAARRRMETRIPAEELRVGDMVIVKPGEKIAADGVVARGASCVNQAPITGESLPVEKSRRGRGVRRNTEFQGALEIEVTRPVEDTALARIIHLVEEAQARRTPLQTFVDRFARYYTPVVFIVAVAVATVPPLAFGWAWGVGDLSRAGAHRGGMSLRAGDLHPGGDRLRHRQCRAPRRAHQRRRLSGTDGAPVGDRLR